jgi:hypothetical protein
MTVRWIARRCRVTLSVSLPVLTAEFVHGTKREHSLTFFQIAHWPRFVV